MQEIDKKILTLKHDLEEDKSSQQFSQTAMAVQSDPQKKQKIKVNPPLIPIPVRF